MSDQQAAVIHGVLAGTESGEAAFSDFSTSVADRVLEVVEDSFVAGVQFSFRVVGVIALSGCDRDRRRPPEARARACVAAALLGRATGRRSPGRTRTCRTPRDSK